jgi:hypothetical protein
MRIRTLALSGAAVLVAVLGVAVPASATAAPAHHGGGGTTPPPPTLTVSPSSLNFGSVEVGTTSAPQTLTVTNTGSTTGEVAGLDIQDPPGTGGAGGVGEFTLQVSGPGQDCTEVVLAPGASCSESLTFTPFLAGPQPIVVYVEADANGTEPYQNVATASVTGNGTSPGAVLASFTLPSQLAQNDYKVVGGQSVTITANLSTAIGGPCATFSQPITVALSPIMYPAGVASVPSQVVVPAGQCSASFTVTTAATTTGGDLQVTGLATEDPNLADVDAVGFGFTILP